MRTGKKDNIKLNNAGVSLVELLVVIAIMGVLAGGSALGISLLFSKDAQQGAIKLNDALTSARMYTMSKSGDYSLVLSGDSSNQFVTRIFDGTNPDPVEEFYLEDPSGGRKLEKIEVNFTVDSSYPGGSVGVKQLPVTIKFNKNKGCVDYVKFGTGSDEFNLEYYNAMLEFDITSTRGSGNRKNAVVQLITATGKHGIGDL